MAAMPMAATTWQLATWEQPGRAFVASLVGWVGLSAFSQPPQIKPVDEAKSAGSVIQVPQKSRWLGGAGAAEPP
jgi:hypothetical protein